MARRPQEALRGLSEAEREEVERLSRSDSERVDRVRRATAVLAVAEGRSFVAAATQAGLRSGSTVTGLVRRFNRRGLAALGIAAGRGRRPTYDAAARATIVATAQRTPDRRADGTATWSLSTLERTVRREGLAAIGATTIRRVLHAAGSSYQRSRTWCPTGTAVRQRKSGPVTVTDPQTEQKRG
jgi:transposase